MSVITYETEELMPSFFDRVFNRPIKYKWKKSVDIFNHDWITIGSGSMYAMGALKSGASPIDAIKTTSSLDSSTGDDVVWVYIP